MPGAIAGEEVGGTYQFTIAADVAEIMTFYQTELTNLGFEVEVGVGENVTQAFLNFQKGDTSGTVAIISLDGGLNGVAILINQ